MGKMKNIKKPLYRCTCPDCKTIFDAEYEDFMHKSMDGGYKTLVIYCPTCQGEIRFVDKDEVKPIYPRKAKESGK